MKKILDVLFKLVFVAVAFAVIPSCSKDGKINHLSGVVRDDEGKPLKDVVVTSANVSVKTDENGIFNLEHITQIDNRFVVDFSHAGYFNVVRSAFCDQTEMIEVMMLPTKKEGVSNSTSFNSQKGGTVSVGKMNVNIPKNSLVKSDGTPYTGKVDFKMLYLDPNTEHFAATMPGGDLAAKDTSGEVALVSYGMVDVVMTDANGGKLQLKKGTKSELTFPIPAGMENKAPNEMPLWSFNENNGVWEKSGMAVRQGDVYVGTVGHFSWVNLDDPKQFVVLKGKVKDSDGNPISGLRLTIEQVSAITLPDGSYSVRIPCDTEVNIKVKSADFNNYSPEVSVKVPAQPGNSTFTQDITLPSLPIVKGKISNTCGDNYNFILYCKYIDAQGDSACTGMTICKKNGEFNLRLPIGCTSPVLYVSQPDGQKVEHVFTYSGEKETNVGTISTCYIELLKREQPSLNIDGKNETFKYDDCDYTCYSDSIKSFVISFNEDLYIRLLNYKEGVSSYDAEIKLLKQNYFSTSARVEKRKVGNSVQLKITSAGYTEKDSVKKDATFNAVVYAPLLYRGTCNSLSDICLPTGMNNVRMPITYAFEQLILGMPDVWLCYDKYSSEMDADFLFTASECKEPLHLTMTYKNATKDDYNKLESQLIEKGFEMKDISKGKRFIINDIEMDVYYGNFTIEKGGVKKEMKMTVQVTTGIMLWFKSLAMKYLGLDWF